MKNFNINNISNQNRQFELSEDFQAKMTVEQLKTLLSQFGITPDQMFDQMNKTLIRMKDELDKTS